MPSAPRLAALVAALALAPGSAGPAGREAGSAAPGGAGAASAADGAPRSAAHDEAVARMRFAWPAPLRARVTHRRTRSGTGLASTTFTARYDTSAEATADGLRVSTRRTSWRGDAPFPDALQAEAVAASEQIIQRVRADGEFAGLEGLDAMRPVLARVFEEASVPPEAAERALPHAEARMRAEAEELWNLAVGFWTGADLRIGERYALSAEGEIPLLPGVLAPQTVEFGVRRRVPCTARERERRCVEATLRSTADRAALARAKDALLARLGRRGAAPEKDAGEPSAESALVLVTEPGTLLPRRVVWTRAIRIAGAERGAPAAELVDRVEYDYSYLPPEPPPRERRPGRREPAAPAPPGPRA